MKITYLYNSGFTVDFGDMLLVFDCISVDERMSISKGFINREYIQSFDRVYFFVSHKHADHYIKSIYSFASSKVKYVLASGTPGIPGNVGHIILKRGDFYKDDNIFVKAYGSTDIGISFFLRVSGTTLFFAGDLNCWHWTIDSTYEEELFARQAFTDELLYIKEDISNTQIDLAFFPLDPRMRGGYDDGAMEFYSMFKPKLFIPMHFRHEVSVCEIFANKISGEVFKIKKPGDNIEIRK